MFLIRFQQQQQILRSMNLSTKMSPNHFEISYITYYKFITRKIPIFTGQRTQIQLQRQQQKNNRMREVHHFSICLVFIT